MLDVEDQASYPLHRQRVPFGTSAVGEGRGFYSISSKLKDNNVCACTNTELASHSIPALGMSLTLHFSSFLHTNLLYLLRAYVFLNCFFVLKTVNHSFRELVESRNERCMMAHLEITIQESSSTSWISIQSTIIC